MLDIDREPFINPAPIGWVRLQEVANLPLLNILGSIAQTPHNIRDQSLIRIRLHQAEKIP